MVQVFYQYHEALLHGFVVTMKLSVAIWVIGIFGGLCLTLITKYSKEWRRIFNSISFIVSGIPVIVLLFMLHYPFQQYFGIVIDPFYTTVLSLSFVNIFAVYSLQVPLLDSIGNRAGSMARVLGNSRKVILFKIELPLLLRRSLEGIIQIQINMMHMTLFSSLISVNEIFRVAQKINAIAYKTVDIYLVVGLIFVLFSMLIHVTFLIFRNKTQYDNT